MRIHKVMNYREFAHILSQNGFTPVRKSGSHVIFKRANDTIVVSHKPNRMIIERMVKTYNLQLI